MSLQDRVKNPPKSASYVSPIDRWIATLPKEEAEAAKQMLLDPKSWSQRSIIEAFREEGHRTSLDTVSAWRRMNNVTGR